MYIYSYKKLIKICPISVISIWMRLHNGRVSSQPSIQSSQQTVELEQSKKILHKMDGESETQLGEDVGNNIVRNLLILFPIN